MYNPTDLEHRLGRPEITWLAERAKLCLDEAELALAERDLRAVVVLMDTVAGTDAGDAPRPQGLTLADLREDEIEPSLPREMLLDGQQGWAGCLKKDTFFIVPKII